MHMIAIVIYLHEAHIFCVASIVYSLVLFFSSNSSQRAPKHGELLKLNYLSSYSSVEYRI
jgi:hypothetical protein